MRLRWSAANRCRADARVTRLLSQPGRNSPQLKQTSFVSQQHWTTHYSTQMQPRPWNKASLPCGTVCLFIAIVLYYIVAHEWALLSYLMMAFSTGDTWAQKWVMITDTFVKHHCVPTSADIWTRMQQDRTTKLEGWNSQCMPSLRCISQHFLFAVQL